MSRVRVSGLFPVYVGFFFCVYRALLSVLSALQHASECAILLKQKDQNREYQVSFLCM